MFTVGDINAALISAVAGAAGTGTPSGGLAPSAGVNGVILLSPTQTVIPSGQTLAISGNTASGNVVFSTSNYNVAGTLTLTNSSQTISTLTGPGSVTLTGTTLNIGSGDASGTFSGNITGNGGITKIGLGTLTLTGTGNAFSGGLTISAGAVQGSVASLPAAITDNANVAFNESGTTTYSGSIAGTGSVTKLGAGTLTLGGGQGYSGGTTVAAGTLNVADDTALGAAGAPVTVQPLGALTYTGSTTTARTFTLYNSPLSAAAGATVTLNGATVGGGVLAGPGSFTLTGGTALVGMTIRPNSALNLTGPAGLTNVTNGAALAVAAGLPSPVTFTGFTNQGSGSITVGAASKVNVADFQSYGTVTINPADTGSPFTELVNTGSSAMYFNGGSRTFIGTPGTATASPPLAGIDLHGENLVIAGGLFVNNGFVTDSTTPKGSVIVDFGALYKGAGTSFVPVITQNGGKVQAGNSPGSAGFGRFVFGPGGVNNYVFAIDDATGTAGPSPDAAGHVSGWGLVKAVRQAFGATTSSGDFTWTATPTAKLTFAIDTLVNPTTVGTDVAGPMDHFDPNSAYSWPAVRWAGTYSGPTDAAALNADTAFDTSGFLNPDAGKFGWSLDPDGQMLSLLYTPTAVPEPGTVALVGLAAAGFTCWRRSQTTSRSLPSPA
jgi:autotransporter-associated beta strand protein